MTITVELTNPWHVGLFLGLLLAGVLWRQIYRVALIVVRTRRRAVAKKHLDVAERKFCELVALGGLKETDAVRACWPSLKPTGVWKKVQTLSKNVLVQSYLSQCEKRSLAEIMRVRKRALDTAEGICVDPNYPVHKHFASIFGSLINATNRRADVDEDAKPTNTTIILKLEE